MAFEEENPEGYLGAEYSTKLDEFVIPLNEDILFYFPYSKSPLHTFYTCII
jgi:hypothetical protein